jgi:hypothetical protein
VFVVSNDTAYAIFLFAFNSSKNGSPVEADPVVGKCDEVSLVALISKPTAGGGLQWLIVTGSTLKLDVGHGKFIALHDRSNMAKLPKSQQEDTRLQLQLLKEQVDLALQPLQDD